MKFNNYNFKKYILETLENMKFDTLTDVQEKTIPFLLKNKNAIVQSETGSGKTLAYLLPNLNNIDEDRNSIQSIIFVPTRDLALQLKKVILNFTKSNSNLNMSLVIGGNDFAGKNINNSNIIIGTPSKIRDLYNLGKLNITNLTNIVFDEFDMICELGFLSDINFMLSKIKNIKKINISAFSATISQQMEVFFNKNIINPNFINLIENNDRHNKNINHFLVRTKHKKLNIVLKNLLDTFNPFICLIFVNKKEEVDGIYNFLLENNLKVCKIHGEMQTRKRKQIIKKINSLEYNYVVATDLLARGIDIEGVSHVISINLPKDLKYYIHRSGRTGRYNQIGNSYILSDYDNMNEISLLKKMGLNFKEMILKNDEFIEKEYKPKKHNTYDKNQEKKQDKKYDYKKNMIYSKFSDVKPGYKKKLKTKIKKMTKKR